MSDWNTAVMAEFRANGGKVAQFGDAPMVILNTIGAKSGELREIPLVMLESDGRQFVFASAAGSPRHPDWYRNVTATPEIDVEIGTDKLKVRIDELGEPERTQRFAEQAALMPQFGEYEGKAAPRVIPVLELVPI